MSMKFEEKSSEEKSSKIQVQQLLPLECVQPMHDGNCVTEKQSPRTISKIFPSSDSAIGRSAFLISKNGDFCYFTMPYKCSPSGEDCRLPTIPSFLSRLSLRVHFAQAVYDQVSCHHKQNHDCKIIQNEQHDWLSEIKKGKRCPS